LAKGYWQYYHRVSGLYPDRFDAADKFVLLFKIRKIMFLTYISEGELMKAFKYLLTGRTHKIQSKDAR
jgi:hypothetical protein